MRPQCSGLCNGVAENNDGIKKDEYWGDNSIMPSILHIFHTRLRRKMKKRPYVVWCKWIYLRLKFCCCCNHPSVPAGHHYCKTYCSGLDQDRPTSQTHWSCKLENKFFVKIKMFSETKPFSWCQWSVVTRPQRPHRNEVMLYLIPCAGQRSKCSFHRANVLIHPPQTFNDVK